MTNDQLKEIGARCKAAKRVPAHCKRCKWFTDIPACLDEIERLRGLVKTAFREGIMGLTDDEARQVWANSESRKALEQE